MYILTIFLLSLPIASPLTCNCTVDQEQCSDIGTCTTEGLCVGQLVLTSTPFITQKCISINEISSTCSIHVPTTSRYCCNTDFCNNITAVQEYLTITRAITMIKTATHTHSSNKSGQYSNPTTPAYIHPLGIFPVAISVATVCLFIIALVSAVITVPLVLRYCRDTGYRGPHDYRKRLHLHEELSLELDSTYGSGSGSGAGMAQLSQVTIARQVEKQRLIGIGRYGQVWQGVWRHQQVAVKMFNSSDATSWEAETEIFMTDLLRHENILGFIAADKFDMDYSLQYWIITDYISNGSLMEYLSERTLSVRDTLRLAKGIASGVSHLHTEIKGGHRFNSNAALYKPCVVHRDIKSRNILVSASGEAVLADFGLAVRYCEDTPQYLFNLFYRREGTRRYMSPELLQDRVEENDICEVYKRADIYSLCLVLWEICRRCETEGVCEHSELPYFHCVSREPSFDEMRDMVLVRGERPHIPNRWSLIKEVREIAEIMRECWKTGQNEIDQLSNCPPTLPHLLIKKKLVSLYEQL